MAESVVPVSVLLPAYNAARYVASSVQSVLGQTFEDFELLVVDDGSTDNTVDILSGIADRRLRIIRNPRNLGIVGTLNRAMAHARGRYIARMDADDYCQPTRFAKQKHFLDRNPDVTLVGAEMSILEDGRIWWSREGNPDPLVLRWQSLVINPVGHSTMMFRAELVGRLGAYLREDFRYAEDFDFSHRVLRVGNIAVLPEYLGIYRKHPQNLTSTGHDKVIAKVTSVLRETYSALLGRDAAAEATLAATYLFARTPAKDLPTLRQVATLLDRLLTAFLSVHEPSKEQTAQIVAHANRLWWRTIQASLRAGALLPPMLGHDLFGRGRIGRPALHRLAKTAAGGLFRRAWPQPNRHAENGQARTHAGGNPAIENPKDEPPRLYVVVDMEPESERQKPSAGASGGVGANTDQEHAQAIFEARGLRPLYVIGDTVASRPEAYEPLRRILERHAGVIGARLGSWKGPSFGVNAAPDARTGGQQSDPTDRQLRALVETIERNLTRAEIGAWDGSRLPAGRDFDSEGAAGPQAAEWEGRKLRGLVDAIAQNLRVAPLFFKVGSDDPGSASPAAATGDGIERGSGILCADWPAQDGADARPTQRRRVASGTVRLAPLGLRSVVMLTPEDVPARKQDRLIRSTVGQGYRNFLLRYRGPSLLAGSMPGDGTAAEPGELLRRIEAICELFFDTLGGLPGNPADLLPQHMRERVWPEHSLSLGMAEAGRVTAG